MVDALFLFIRHTFSKISKARGPQPFPKTPGHLVDPLCFSLSHPSLKHARAARAVYLEVGEDTAT